MSRLLCYYKSFKPYTCLLTTEPKTRCAGNRAVQRHSVQIVNMSTNNVDGITNGTDKLNIDESKQQRTSATKPKQSKQPTVIEYPAYITNRLSIAELLQKSAADTLKPSNTITITLPDGSTKSGTAHTTTPFEIAKSISTSLSKKVIIAKVNDQLYDVHRPLESDCTLALLDLENGGAEVQHVFWHSSAHVLGQAIELEYAQYGPQLCIGPALSDGGFYYDVYFTEPYTISQADYDKIEKRCQQIIKQKQQYTRLTLQKQQALNMFSDNRFKQEIINNKVPDNETCTAYHSGPLIDLCRGPHIANTSQIGYIHIYNHGSAYWLGNSNNPTLQRVYGISFADKKQLDEWKTLRQKALDNDHRKIGTEQKLYFFHEYSPGSPFFLPHGARIYNTLVQFIKQEYWKRGYTEVISPNVYSTKLWQTSGHYENYKENMFLFEVEKQEFGMKPMNCITGDALISLTNNTSQRLDSLLNNTSNVYGLDENGTQLIPTKQHHWLDQGMKSCVELTFIDGRKLVCTPDHKLYTVSGWMEAGTVLNRHVYAGVEQPVVDISESQNCQWELVVGTMTFSMVDNSSIQRSLAFARLCGLCLTDGSITTDGSECELYLGHELDVQCVVQDVELLVGKQCSYRFCSDRNLWCVRVPSTLSRCMSNICGTGGRMNKAFTLQHINSADTPVQFVRQFLSGMFGGDGWAPCLAKGGKFTEIYLALSKSESMLPGHYDYMKHLVELLDYSGISNVTIDGPYKNQKGVNHHYRLKIPMSQIIQFSKYIGFGYNCHKAQRLAAVNSYYKLKQSVISEHMSFVNKVKSLMYSSTGKKVMKGTSAYKHIYNATVRSVHYTHTKKYTLPSYDSVRKTILNNTTLRNIGGKGFYTPAQYLAEINALLYFTERYAVGRGKYLPMFELQVIDIRPVGMKQVYDISVDPNIQSFVANGIVVHNCPGHCLMFASSLKSYRDLPLRYADFGVLHRNEFSGALTGLTRVRRFQQDDAHIFCMASQIEQEVAGVLDMLKSVYKIFDFTFELQLSTRPEKFLGAIEQWDKAEQALTDTLNKEFGADGWSVNPGDGAFYGPKIDIKLMDALKRKHQCATIQLDFQLPQRFELQYKSEGEGFDRPVMIHRAILGSVERMIAVLCEHTGGKWPFWLSPRQCIVVPVTAIYNDYAVQIQQLIHNAGYFVDIDTGKNQFNKKVREAQIQQYNMILIVGEKEQENNSVNIRYRDNQQQVEYKLTDLIPYFDKLKAEYQ